MTLILSDDWLSNWLPILLIFLIWFAPVLVALSKLRKQPLGDLAKAVWVLIILAAPIIGAITYLVFNSKTQNSVLDGRKVS